MLPNETFAQPHSEAGAPLLRNYSPLDYDAHADNYDAVQGPRGLMYFANGDGVLTYDGAEWNVIETPDHAYVQALALSESGTLFVGGAHEVGYLSAGPSGELGYVSLRHLLPRGTPETFDIARVHATPDGIIFVGQDQLMCWDGERFRVWPASDPLGASAWVDGRLVLGAPGGLAEFRGDSLYVLPGSGGLDGQVRAIARYDAQRLLVATGERLMLYDGRALTSLTEATALGTAAFTALADLGNGTFAVGTADAGVRFVGAAGQPLRAVSEESGLRVNSVRFLYPDAQGALWIGLGDGMARLGGLEAVTRFGSSDGLRGQPGEVTRHRGRLYVGTTEGVFRLAPGTPPRFEAVARGGLEPSAFLSVGAHLLALGDSGLHQIDGMSGERITRGPGFALSPIAERTDAVLVGGPDGLDELRYDAARERWDMPRRVATFAGGVREITPHAQSGYWLVIVPDGLAWVTFPDGLEAAPRVVTYGPEHDLPGGELVVVPSPGGDMISALDGLYRLDEASQRFVRDERLGEAVARGDTVLVDPIRTSNGIWSSILADDDNSTLEVRRFAETAPGRYHLDPLVGLRAMPTVTTWDFHVEEPKANSIAWVTTSEYLYRYDPERASLGKARQPLVRSVEVGDSLAFGGEASTASGHMTLGAGHAPLRFSYALPIFAAPERTRYQVRLGGFDEWSNWTDESRKDYTRLPSGDYAFEVRARDLYGRVTQSEAFAFTVRSAWYATGWAYLFYTLIGLGLVAGVFRWRLASLSARAKALERTVAERTARIAEQAGKLRELDVAKTHFFANVSHELRTPLTLMLGPLSQLHAAAPTTQPPHVQEQLSMMLRNGQRLQRLVNQILDLTKLEAGSVRYDPRVQNLALYVRQHVKLYAGLAQYRGLEMSVRTLADPVDVKFDARHMEKVLANLLSNALKFTDTGGSVAVTVASQGGRAVVSVADTGVGIPADKLARVFDRFYQVEETTTRTYEGTGIGLALASELVHLHGGTLTATSEPGRGSTFTVRLPLASPIRPERAAPAEPPGAAADLASLHARAQGDGSVETSAPEMQPVAEERAFADQQSGPLVAPPVGGDAADDQTTVLVVEDNADMRAFVRSVLEPQYRVLESADGEDGLRQARLSLPDLILSDVMMPRMDGLTMSRALREDPETGSIPVVLLTARAGRDDQLDGLDTGATAYLVKPFDADVLRLQVSNLIGQQQRLRERLSIRPLRAPEPMQDQPEPAPQSALEEQVIGIIGEHLADPQFSVEALAEAVGLSRQQLYRRLKEDTSDTPVAYIRRYRLERAAQLLRERQGNVSEVAYAVGFNSLSYFSRCFGDQFGQTPSAFVTSAKE